MNKNLKILSALTISAIAIFSAGIYFSLQKSTSPSYSLNKVLGTAATGGATSTDGTYMIHTFTASSTFVVTATGTVDVLVVGGGGGGTSGGGGGAGGVIATTSFTVTPQSYAVTIGVGGVGGANDNSTTGYNGGTSTFATLNAKGGGGGGRGQSAAPNGVAGGSGGGAGIDGGVSGTGGAGTAGQGNNGGNNTNVANYGGGGGGGAGAVGANGTTAVGGNGGAGIANSFSGTSTFYGGGGGGGIYTAGTGGTGGTGGGGNGGAGANASGTDGIANTGGGGGACGSSGYKGHGGSGIVIIRYLIDTGSTIALTDVADRKVIQRDSSNQGSVAVTGTFTGTTPSVEAKVINATSSATIIDWTTLDASPNVASGTFSGTIASIPQGGWYNILVRNSQATTTVATGTNRFGVGTVILAIGQSNMNRLFNPTFSGSSLTPNPTVVMHNGSAFATVTGDGAIKLGNDINNSLNIPVCLLNYSVDGSAISTWQKGQANYASSTAGVTSAGGALEFILWLQGETDAGDGTAKATYKSALEQMLSDFRADLTSPKATLKAILSVIGRYTDDPGTDAVISDIRDATMEVAAEANNYYGSVNVSIPLANGNTVHYSAAGYVTTAQNMANSVLYSLGSSSYIRGPRISGYSVANSTTIDVHVIHSGGNDITPATGITGFEVLDNGVAKTISSAARLNATTIRLTLSTGYSGTLTVRYQYGKAPDVSAPVYDNSGLALPLEFNNSMSQVTTKKIFIIIR